jgi:SWI/SNF-related matrix-associated actin-dependent regulator 1 of chromatin subfamily A
MGYYHVGKHLLGWIYNPTSWEDEQNIKEWGFSQKFNHIYYIPFPSLPGEWKQMKDLFKDSDICFEDDIVRKILKNGKQRFLLSHAKELNNEYDIEGLKIKPFPFQLASVYYLESLNYRGLVGDDMGLGKTMTGIAAACKTKSNRVVVVTRSVALDAWKRSINNWTDYTCLTAQGKSIVKSKRKDGSIKRTDNVILLNDDPSQINTSNSFIILNYDILDKWLDFIQAYNPEMIIFDECHIIKEPTAARSKAAYQLMAHIEKVICLSGTPIPNRPIEAFHILNGLHPGKWGNYFKFAERYCNAHYEQIGWEYINTGNYVIRNGLRVPEKIKQPKKVLNVQGASNTKELYLRLRATCMVRRLKDDVLDLLPALEETILLQPSKEYKEIENSHLNDIELILNKETQEKGIASIHELFAAAADDKIEWAKEWIKAFIEDTDNKLVIFFHHKKIGHALHEFLNQLGVKHINLWGEKPDKGGDYLFQTDDSIKIALCSYGVAREAVTLTSAAYQLILEFAWVPGWMDQAKDRIRRIGQTKGTNYYYPLLKESVEENIVRALLSKQDILSVIMQGIHKKNINIEL